MDRTTFKIKGHIMMSIIPHLACVLHNENIKTSKYIRLDIIQPIDPSQKWSIICFFNMQKHLRKNLEQNSLFATLKCFYDKSVVVRKEEKRSTFASTLSSLEHPLTIEIKT